MKENTPEITVKIEFVTREEGKVGARSGTLGPSEF